jgi:4-amino-4-deoxy-L-arabinose transferase-like glycosyltransferase
LLIAPLVWSLTPILYGGDTALPFAGPDLEQTNRHPPDAASYLSTKPLYNYLLDNRGDETFLFASFRASDTAPYILASGEPVMAMGGFSGSDPILTPDELLAMIQSGEVRFFLLTGDNNQQADLLRFIRTQCQVVPQTDAGLPPLPQLQPGMQMPTVPRLFDCGNLRD